MLFLRIIAARHHNRQPLVFMAFLAQEKCRIAAACALELQCDLGVQSSRACKAEDSTMDEATSMRAMIEFLEPRQLLAGFDVLVFSRTAAFRHDSIPAGIQMIQQLG